MKRTSLLSAATPLAVAAAAILAVGDLNPPAGAVAATGKRLTEVEPRIALSATNTPGDANSVYKIVQSGSYYLTGNLFVGVGKHGIEIATDHVSIDLNGFEISGGLGSLDGIVGSGSGCSVRNGSIHGLGGDGVDFLSGLANVGTLEDLKVYSNVGDGIACYDNFVIRNCVVRSVGGNGISIVYGGSVTDCAATYCDIAGIDGGQSVVISNCTSNYNVVGIDASSACRVFGCTTVFNSGDGIRVGSDSFIQGNLCDSNGNNGDGAGIHALSSDARIEGNSCTDNDRGIDIDFAGNFVTRNTCGGNTTNWDIIAGNAVGPIVLTSASAAILGNTGASSLGSSDANANFSY